jgi:SynChlorMet cassette protein ScmD
MNRADTPLTNPNVILREEFDDWAVLFNPDTGDAEGINPIGVAVWNRMDGQRSLEDIVAEIHNSFADVSDSALEEIGVFVDTLAEHGFVGYALKESN